MCCFKCKQKLAGVLCVGLLPLPKKQGQFHLFFEQIFCAIFPHSADKKEFCNGT